MLISVLLCTHHPRPDHLRAALLALQKQTLDLRAWELILVDSASRPAVNSSLIAWHPRGRVVREAVAGLTRARRRGITEACADLLVFCDDDNLLAHDYLRQSVEVFAENPGLGAAGGRALPRYEIEPPTWALPFTDRLAVRDLGQDVQLASWREVPTPHRFYPACSPIGAGLILRRSVAETYAEGLSFTPSIPDRVGRRLSSGGDNDMVLTALAAGWQVGYFPQLVLTHLIPRARLSLSYLARLNRAGSESWVGVLARHGLNPWPRISRPTLALRQMRAWFRQRTWRGPAFHIAWAGACGILAGRANLSRR